MCYIHNIKILNEWSRLYPLGVYIPWTIRFYHTCFSWMDPCGCKLQSHLLTVINHWAHSDSTHFVALFWGLSDVCEDGRAVSGRDVAHTWHRWGFNDVASFLQTGAKRDVSAAARKKLWGPRWFGGSLTFPPASVFFFPQWVSELEALSESPLKCIPPWRLRATGPEK